MTFTFCSVIIPIVKINFQEVIMTYYNLIHNNTNNTKSYGVKITKERKIENISPNYSSVKKLVDTCNHYSVDYDHFDDILENYLSDQKTF